MIYPPKLKELTIDSFILKSNRKIVNLPKNQEFQRLIFYFCDLKLVTEEFFTNLKDHLLSRITF